MKLDELIGSLQTFEMNLKQKKKEKSIALQAKVQKSPEENESDDQDDLAESLTWLTRDFEKF